GQGQRGFDSEQAANAWREKNAPRKYKAGIFANGKIKWKTFKHKKAADDYIHRNQVDIADGTYRDIKKCTFKEYGEHWKATHLHDLKPSVVNGYLSNLAAHIGPEFDHMQLQAITSAEINVFKAKLFRKKSCRKRP